MNSDGFISMFLLLLRLQAIRSKALDEIGMTQADLPGAWDVKEDDKRDRQGKAVITHETALQLERVLGVPALLESPGGELPAAPSEIQGSMPP